MKVYYNGGFWRHRDRSHAGQKRELNAMFEWGSERWHIPAAYLCAKGLVLDICAEIDPHTMKAFMEKWQLPGEEHFNEAERRRLELDNPMDIGFRAAICLNGREIRADHSSSVGFVPRMCYPQEMEWFEEMHGPKEARELLAYYGLDPQKVWRFHRISFPWPTRRKPQLRSLYVQMEREPETIYGERFSNPSVGQKIGFTHPVTGTQHCLTVLAYEQGEFDMRGCEDGQLEFPKYHMSMTYALEPDLSEIHFAVRDCLENDEPRQKRTDAYTPRMTYDAAIALIGGADGPTAFFVAGVNVEKPHCALSALHFEPAADVEWQIEFREQMVKTKEYCLIGG